ncbi:MAG: TonB-dependent receptor [Myxococcota bacterium]
MLVVLHLALGAAAEEPPVPVDGDDDGDPDFVPTEALRDYVAVSTKVTQPAIETPASVSVITSEQIARAGYRSVAEALATVPGFYVSYDLVNYNVAVRGALGGARGGGRLLKVMIDGVPVPFSESETYFLGPEFVPITSIERIEVLRGPASSLYGAGAYAGAVNVVTRQEPYDGQVSGSGELRGYYGALGVSGPGGDATVQLTTRTTNLLLGIAGASEDRSGLAYPDPARYGADPNLAAWLTLRRAELGDTATEQSDDRAIPVVAFGRAIQAVGGGRLSLFSVAQISQRDAEFSDLSVLSHDTRNALANWKVAAAYERPFGAGFSATARAATSGGSTLSSDQLQIPGETFYYDRDLSYRNVSGAGELRYDFRNLGFVLVGVDGLYDQQDLPNIDGVTPGTGDRQDLNEPVSAAVTNVAGYAQAVYPLTRGVALAAGGRLDAFRSDPSVAAIDPLTFLQANGRLAVNFDLQDRVALKLIGGTAFKAASPEQLYVANPIPNEIEGDPTIQPQRLFGAEAVLEGYPASTVLVSASLFGNLYRDTIGYQLVAGDQLATSYDANNFGAELTGRLTPPIADAGFLDAQLSLSLQDTVTLAADDGATDPFAVGDGKDFPDNEAVPVVMTYERVGIVLERYWSALVIEHHHVGDRTPSQSNLLRCTIVNMADPCYALPAFDLVDLSLSTTAIPMSDELSIRGLAKVSNLLDQDYLEVGFNGVDVPGLGRTFWLRLDLLL